MLSLTFGPALIVALAGAPAVAPAPGATKSATTSAAPGRLDLGAVVDRVQKRYDGALDFRARFAQTLTNAATGRKSEASGEVLLKKPGRMRWNYEKPDKKMYLADGESLWLYEPDDKQAFRQSLEASQLPATLAFLTGKGKLADEFEISFAAGSGFGTDKDYVLRLVPKKVQAQVKGLLFVVDPEAFVVRESVIVDSQGNVNHMALSDVKTNVKVADGTFKWKPPAGVRVIEPGAPPAPKAPAAKVPAP